MSDQKTKLVIACDDVEYRRVIAALLASSPRVKIVERRPQGEEGAAHVLRVDPDVVILGVAPSADCASHARYYRDCFNGGLICFAFNQEQVNAYRANGFLCVVQGGATRADLEARVCEAATAYRGASA